MTPAWTGPTATSWTSSPSTRKNGPSPIAAVAAARPGQRARHGRLVPHRLEPGVSLRADVVLLGDFPLEKVRRRALRVSATARILGTMRGGNAQRLPVRGSESTATSRKLSVRAGVLRRRDPGEANSDAITAPSAAASATIRRKPAIGDERHLGQRRRVCRCACSTKSPALIVRPPGAGPPAGASVSRKPGTNTPRLPVSARRTRGAATARTGSRDERDAGRGGSAGQQTAGTGARNQPCRCAAAAAPPAPCARRTPIMPAKTAARRSEYRTTTAQEPEVTAARRMASSLVNAPKGGAPRIAKKPAIHSAAGDRYPFQGALSRRPISSCRRRRECSRPGGTAPPL